MRISSLQIFNIADNSMASLSQQVLITQEQMSTGRRVLTPADDPVAATKIMQITQELSSVNQYRNNINIAKNSLNLEEASLNTITNLIQRTQELAVAAANTATLSETDYRIMASEVDEQLKEVLNLVNTRNANGDYIFGGYKTGNEPFTGNALTGFQYRGDDGQKFIKVSNNTFVAATDSGKRAFIDIESESPTVNTYASPANISNPPAEISIGRIVDAELYAEFYPEDIVITFNPDNNLTPPNKNYSATERSTGKVILENQPFSVGEEITVQGVTFRLSGSPTSGVAAVPATQNLGVETPVVFPTVIAAPGETFTLQAGGRRETLILEGAFNNVSELVAGLNDATNGNADKLAKLRMDFSASGFSQQDGINFTLANGSTGISAMMGFDVQAGVSSLNGQKEVAGDRLFIDSSEKTDILTTYARFSEAMNAYDGTQESRDELSEAVAATIDNLSNAQTSILDVMASIGARVNTLDSTEALHADAELVSQELLSDIRDIDYAEAATRLSQQTLILQAAQQSFIRVSQLTLFARL